MIHRVFAVSFLLCAACASTKTSETATEGNIFCSWRASEWNSWTPLSLPGMAEPVGTLYPAPWHVLSVDADLHGTPSGQALLEGTLDSDVVNVKIAIDANEQSVLYLTSLKTVGTWLYLTADAPVGISRARPGLLEIRPVKTDLRGITPVTPVSIRMGCEDVTLRMPRFNLLKAGEPPAQPAEMEALGFKSSLPLVKSNEGERLLRETIDGPAVATVNFKEAGAFRVIDEGPNDVRIGIRTGVHSFVIGWVAKGALTASEAGTVGMLRGSSGDSAPPEQVDRFSCSESLGLGIRRDGAVQLWGMLKSNSPFEVLSQPELGWIHVKVKNFRLHEWKGTELVIPERAAQCPHAERVKREPGE